MYSIDTGSYALTEYGKTTMDVYYFYVKREAVKLVVSSLRMKISDFQCRVAI